MNMKKSDTILIFQKPELYFFPHLKDIVYPPYDRREKTPLYYIYRAMNLIKLPISSFFWGSWKNRIKDVKRIIIFDYGYQNCMEKYIKKVNPSCEVILFCWNKVDRVRTNGLKFPIRDKIYSTDPGDCEKYGFKYNHIFYPTDLREDYKPEVSDKLYFIGSDKGRAKSLLYLKKYFEKSGLDVNISVLSQNRDPEYRKKYSEILIDQSLSYEEYISEVRSNGILLDICQSSQRAITMRVLESVVYSKKLITTNQEVRSFPFYNENNILVIDLKSLPSIKEVKRFKEKPFVPYTDEQLYGISVEHWLKGF